MKAAVQHTRSRRTSNSLSNNFPQSLYVIGLGQMGGSWVLASRKKKIFARIAGWDIRPEVRKRAATELQLQMMKFQHGMMESDMVVLAVPIHEIMKYLVRICQHFNRPLILDLGSTKSEIMKWVEKQHADLRFVGGHPLAGTEKPGPAGWNELLFENRPFFLCPRKNGTSSTVDLKTVRTVLTKLGANPAAVDPDVHDRVLAFTSHLPYVVAVSLIKAFVDSAFTSHSLFAGPGFESTTRLALSSPQMVQGIIRTNRDNIVDALESFENALHLIKNQIYRKDWVNLLRELKQIQARKRVLSHDKD